MAVVEAVGYDPSALALCGGKSGPARLLAPGEIPNLYDGFALPNKWMTVATVPQNYILTLWENLNFGGSQIELEGGQRYDLALYGWSGRASSAKLLPDDCQVVSVEFDDSEAIYGPLSEPDISKAMAANSCNPESGTVSSHTLSVSSTVEQTEEWDRSMEVGFSMMVGVEAQESAGFLGTGVSVTESASFTASLNASFGTSGSKTSSVTHESEVQVTLQPGYSAELGLVTQTQTVTGMKCVRTMRNNRTGDEFTDSATVSGTVVTVTETVSEVAA